MSGAATPTSASPERDILVVAGMHRSGTSAMARVLGLAGAHMPERLIKPGSDNPLGFWEPQDIVALNDEILRIIGSDWNDAFGIRADELASAHEDLVERARSILSLNYGDAPLAVMKDPRVSNLVSLWRKAMQAEGFAPAFVIMVRDPLEVAQSIAARGGGSIQGSMLSWLSHMISVERDTRDLPRVFVSYDALVEDWEGVLAKVRRDLSLPLPVSSDQALEISNFLSRSARHHAADDTTWINRSDLWPGIAEAWRWLKSATEDEGPQTAFPSNVADDLTMLSTQLGPVVEAQGQMAKRRELDLRSVLADREAVVLRLRAQALEFEATVADLSRALAIARQESAEAGATAIKAASGQKRLDRDVKALRTHLLDIDRLHRITLEQAAEDLTTERNRIAQLEHDLLAARAEVTDHQHRADATSEEVARLTASLASGSEALAASEDRARELAAELQAKQGELAAVLASPSWSLTRPIRVVSERLTGKPG